MSVSFSERRLRLSAHLGLALVQIALLRAFARDWAIIDGFPLDDAWIHQVVARTLATTGTLGYAAGHHGAAATSYLWATVLAANFRFLHADPAAYTLALNGACYLGVGQVVLALLARGADTAQLPVALLTSAFVAAFACEGGNFLWFAYSGMESVLLVLLALVAIVLYVPAPGSRPTAVTAAGTGLAAGALVLTRPEAAVLGGLLALASSRLGRSRRDVALLIVGWTAGLALYVGSNLIATGAALPATLGGRRWLWLDGDAGLSHARIVWEFACDWLLRLRNGSLGTSATWLLWVSLGLALYGVVAWIRERNTAMLAVVAWTLVHVATYVVMMPVAGHGGRYQPLVPLVYLAALGVGSMRLVERGAALVRRRASRSWARGGLAVASLAPWVVLVGVGVRDWGGDNAKAVVHIRATECALGEAMNELPPGARVASFDIGCSGFFSQRPVIDIGGLSDPATVTLMKEGRIWEHLRDQGVEYVALPLAYDDDTLDPVNFAERLRFVGNPAVHLEPLRYFSSPLYVWLPGVLATQHSAPRQGLFRLTYTGLPGPRSGATIRATHPPLHDADGLVGRRMSAQLDDSLAVLAGAGRPVDLTVRLGAPALSTRSSDAWAVSIGPEGITAVPPARDRVPEDEARAMVAEAVLPYLRIGDFDGAAAASLQAVAHAERRWSDPLFFPRLPGLLPPGASPSPAAPGETSAWGLPLAVLVFALGVGVEALARQASLTTTRRTTRKLADSPT